MSKLALITGITGQDGSYLAEFLLEKGYKIVGTIRRTSTVNTERISHIIKDLTLESADLLDQTSISTIISKYKPDEIYNLAAQPFVPESFKEPVYTTEVNSVGALRILEAIRLYSPESKFYQASTSEMFGKVSESPQNETTKFHPRSPYGVSKVYSHYLVQNYREAYNIFACSGILFNHESPRRGIDFVTKKITSSAARIYYGLQDKLYLGNLDARRDWSFAGDMVRAMWLMLQQNTPDDFVVGSGESHSVAEFCQLAFDYLDLGYMNYVEIDPKFFRPAEVDTVVADPTKTRTVLGWEPEYSFKDLVEMMVAYDAKNIKES